MSRRFAMLNSLGNQSSSANLPSVENPMELVKPKPIVVSNYVPQEPIILSAEEWNLVCSKTKDASLPFTVQITVMEKEKEDNSPAEEEKEVQGEVYVPKRMRKYKK